MLWCAWLTANVCMWMNDVAIAWMMTSLTASPVAVALVQTASTLPVFLLGLPCGALADLVNRRRYLIVTQCWVAAVALLLWLAVLSGLTSPALLLGLTFANGIGLAMRWPVFCRHRAGPGAARAIAGGARAQRRVDERLAHHWPAGGRRADRQRRHGLGLCAQRSPVDDRRVAHHALAICSRTRPRSFGAPVPPPSLPGCASPCGRRR